MGKAKSDKMAGAALPPPEFSRVVVAEQCRNIAQHHTIAASPDECAALARRFDLLRMTRFEAELKLTRQKSTQFIHVTGVFRAELAQSCVVSWVEIPQNLRGEIDSYFCPPDFFADSGPNAPSKGDHKGHTIDLELGDADIDEIHDGKIDLGELAAQHLALMLDPFPRAEPAAN
ncbi:MAG: hypothetical protein QM537_05165 [Candidatus Symbiobacter sp.]|nr:hypothetical protein [Candidatus Symbiobacter sp.]